ncbi:hypothetical protein V6N13_133484 [Hibiscus sabdariffa]
MEAFPQEVVANILSRLPLKYLLQLQCVCKAWRSLISDPHFAKLQLAHNCHRFLFFTLPLGSVDTEGFGDDHDLDSVKRLEYPAAEEGSWLCGDFDRRGHYIYGLGYDICTDDYKVVRVRRHFIYVDSDNYSMKCQVEILARKRDIW